MSGGTCVPVSTELAVPPGDLSELERNETEVRRRLLGERFHVVEFQRGGGAVPPSDSAQKMRVDP